MHTRPLTLPRRLVASALVAVAVAAVVHAVTVFVFFVTNGAAAENIVPVSNYFAPSTLILALLVFAAALVGAFRTWWGALAAGLVAGVAATALGTVWAVLGGGNQWSQEALDYLLAFLVGTGLVFELAAAVAAVTVGCAVWRHAVAWRASRPRPVALVRAPSSRLAEGELTHLERTPVEQDRADEQWDAYVAALTAEGFDVVDVAAADEHPDSVFVEDALVVLGDTAIITSPGAESRRGEVEGVRQSIRSLHLHAAEITLPGTLDGGDVLVVGSTVYVGRGGRTNADGIRQLRAIAAPLGYQVVAVKVTKALHLKSVVTALPDGTVIGAPKLVENPAVFERYLQVPEAAGSAVVVLGPDAVLMSAAAPKSAALIADLGYRVVTVDISEFEKLEGCVTCLSVRIP
jgi:dimethylargininase